MKEKYEFYDYSILNNGTTDNCRILNLEGVKESINNLAKNLYKYYSVKFPCILINELYCDSINGNTWGIQEFKIAVKYCVSECNSVIKLIENRPSTNRELNTDLLVVLKEILTLAKDGFIFYEGNNSGSLLCEFDDDDCYFINSEVTKIFVKMKELNFDSSKVLNQLETINSFSSVYKTMDKDISNNYGSKSVIAEIREIPEHFNGEEITKESLERSASFSRDVSIHRDILRRNQEPSKELGTNTKVGLKHMFSEVTPNAMSGLPDYTSLEKYLDYGYSWDDVSLMYRMEKEELKEFIRTRKPNKLV